VELWKADFHNDKMICIWNDDEPETLSADGKEKQQQMCFPGIEIGREIFCAIAKTV
jgi:hypothetical protein